MGETAKAGERKLRSLTLEVTNRCPLHCIHCSSESHPNAVDMLSYNEIVSIIDNAIDLGLEHVSLSGGEPFLHPDIHWILDYLEDQEINYSIYTSGVVNERLQANELFFRDHLRKIVFSVHASNESLTSRITGIKGAFDQTIRSISGALQLDLPVDIHTVPMTVNYHDFADTLKLIKLLGVSSVSILRLVKQGRCNESLIIGRNEYLKLINTAKQLEGLHVRFGSPFNVLSHDCEVCTAGKERLLITSKGDILPCEAFKSYRNASNIRRA